MFKWKTAKNCKLGKKKLYYFLHLTPSCYENWLWFMLGENIGEYNRKLDIKYSQTTSALGLVPMFGSCSNFEVPIVLIPSILPRSRRPTQCPAGRSPEGGFSAAGSVLVLRWSSFYATLPSSPRMGRGHWMSSSRGIYRLCAVSSRSSKCPAGLVTVSSLSPERCAVTSPQSSASWLSSLDWRVICLPNRETNYELCHQLTGLDHLEGRVSQLVEYPSTDNQHGWDYNQYVWFYNKNRKKNKRQCYGF